MKIYFTLITTFCSLIPFCCGRLFSTFYLSYSSRQMVDSRIYVSKRNLLKDVMRSDDSPYQLVQLPFPFIYFGQSLNMLFVSPNGALHSSKNQPCPSHAFCGEFKRNFRGAICGLLTDLNPSTSGPNSYVASYVSSSVAVFSFQNIVYYNSTAFVSFHISIFPDSRVEIAYDHVSYVYQKSKQIFPMQGLWISGLRPPNDSLQNTVFTEADLSITQRYWKYSSLGVYPAGNSVQSGNRFVACPISFEWCLSPSLLNLDSLRHSSDITFTLSTLLLSCRFEVDYAILISVEPVSSWPAPPSSQPSGSPSGRPTLQPFQSPTVLASAVPTSPSPTSLQPTVQLTTRSPQPPSIESSAPSNLIRPTLRTVSFPCKLQSNTSNILICSFSQNPLVLNFTAGVYSITPAWREANSSSDTYTAMPVSPLLLTVKSAISTSKSMCESTVYGTSALSPSCIAGYCPATSGAFPTSSKQSYYNMSICKISLPCLSFPCDNATSPVPYKRKDCMGRCESSGIQSTYFTDAKGACCSLDRLDCAGICNGKSLISNNSEGSLYCCPEHITVDCSGECGGTKVRDACNTCGGTDLTGGTCFNYSGIKVVTGRADLSLRPSVFNVDIAINKNLSISMSFNISNHDFHQIYVVLSVITTEKAFAPDIYISTASSFYMAGNTTTQCVISASYKNLYLGFQTTFKIKYLKVSYARSNALSVKYVKTISLYPPYYSSNCSKLLSMDTCARMPGCIYCLTGSGYRSLLSLAAGGNATIDASSSPEAQQRALFTDLVPFSLLSASREEVDKQGTCRAGWSATFCYSGGTGAASGGPHGDILAACLLIATIAIAFFP